KLWNDQITCLNIPHAWATILTSVTPHLFRNQTSSHNFHNNNVSQSRRSAKGQLAIGSALLCDSYPDTQATIDFAAQSYDAIAWDDHAKLAHVCCWIRTLYARFWLTTSLRGHGTASTFLALA